MSDDRRALESRRFRLDATINITHILTTVGLIIALFKWGSNVETMLVRHDVSIESVKEQQARIDSDTRAQLLEINRKIDRLIERDLDGRRNNK